MGDIRYAQTGNRFGSGVLRNRCGSPHPRRPLQELVMRCATASWRYIGQWYFKFLFLERGVIVLVEDFFHQRKLRLDLPLEYPPPPVFVKLAVDLPRWRILIMVYIYILVALDQLRLVFFLANWFCFGLYW